MDEMTKKYDGLLEKAQTIRSVGQKLADLIKQNQASIEWYEKYIADKLAENPDYDGSYHQQSISELEKENNMLRDVEAMFWKKYVF